MRALSLGLLLVSSTACLPSRTPDNQPPPSSPPYQPPPPGYGRPPVPPGPPQQQPPAPPPPGPANGGDPYGPARQACLDQTNAYRAKVGAAPLVARPDRSACTDQDARGDAANGTVHGESGKCGLMAQNECPSWPGTAAGIVSECLKSMFDEGPGAPYSAHGHYINMTNKDYRGLACGFYEQNGKVWLIQNYFP